MANPSHDVNAYAKHIALHIYQYPVPVTWGGANNLELSSPTVYPFTDGAKEYGLHFAADASPDDAARGITGGVGMLAGGAIMTTVRRHASTLPRPTCTRMRYWLQVPSCIKLCRSVVY